MNEPRNHIEGWPRSHGPGPSGLAASLPGHDEAREHVAPGLMQRPLIWGERGFF